MDYSKMTAEEIVKRYQKRLYQFWVGMVFVFVFYAAIIELISVQQQSRYWVMLCGVLFLFSLTIPYLLFQQFFKKVVNDIYIEMDPEKYADIWKGVKKLKHKTNAVYDVYLAVGEYNAGHFTEAYRLLNEIQIIKVDSFYAIHCYTLMFFCLLHQGRADLAKESISHINNIKNNDHRKAVQKCADSALESINNELLFLQEEYKTYIEIMLEQLQSEKMPYNLVAFHYKLGKLYRITEEYEKAIPHLQYVLDHGNKLFVVEKARDMLHQINNGKEEQS